METYDLTKQEQDVLFEQISKKGGRLVEYVLWGYVCCSILFSFYYDTWLIGIGVSSICIGLYYFTKFLLPHYSLYQYVAAGVQAIFVALFIYQMHGLFEMHFFAFISCTVLIIYQNPYLQIPFIGLVVVHHASFALLQYLGYKEVYFTQLDYMDLHTFIIHALLAGGVSFISGFWAYKLRKQTLASANQNKMIQLKNEELKHINNELQLTEEELRQNLEEISTIQEQLIVKNRIIEKHNDNMQASINYAKRIQQAILPSDEFFKSCLPESFIYYRPKDIVSGDFYFIDQKDEKIYLAVADCTGHGVPGAFMSLIGSESLYYIIKSHPNHQLNSSFILKELNKKIKKTLLQNKARLRDGMEIGMCVIDIKTQTVDFAGARGELIYFKNNQLFSIEGNKHFIGFDILDKESESEEDFTSHSISFADDDITLYLFSDGYKDQFGEISGRKLTSRQFKSLLTTTHSLPISEQYEKLDSFMLEWRGKTTQTDDMLVIGIQLSSSIFKAKTYGSISETVYV